MKYQVLRLIARLIHFYDDLVTNQIELKQELKNLIQKFNRTHQVQSTQLFGVTLC